MNKTLFVLFALLCVSSLAAAPAAPVAAAAATAASSFGQASGDHYLVLSELGKERATALERQLEANFQLFDSVFRFDATAMADKLNVREFKDKAGFDAYLGQIVGQTKDDFVYLHYPTPERSELLLFNKAEPDFSASLAHQAFVQFLKHFIPNPPLWMREGLAVMFESARWDDKAAKLDFQENLAWLETAKSLKERNLFMPLDRLLTVGQEEARSELDVFYPEAWAFVSFLANTEDRAYNRLLWDAISGLRKDASLEENGGTVAKIVKAWYGLADAEKAFADYLASRKTFPELVADGVRQYGDKDWAEATKSFEEAQALTKDSYVPGYYLGLIAYAKNDFTLAETQYKGALGLGCDPAITNYALGVNAYAQNRIEDAKAYLAIARKASPDRYGNKVDELLAKFPK